MLDKEDIKLIIKYSETDDPEIASKLLKKWADEIRIEQEELKKTLTFEDE